MSIVFQKAGLMGCVV